MPPRDVDCPPGSNRNMSDGDERRATTGTGILLPTQPAGPRVRMKLLGLRERWCEREGVRHGPYVAVAKKSRLTIAGSFYFGRRSGEWTYWGLSGRIIRVEEYGRGTLTPQRVVATNCP